MIKVKLPSITLGLAFSHPTENECGSAWYLRSTHCEIFEIRSASGWHIIFLVDGVTICSEKDNFCKETGRKIALARAIEKLRKKLPLPKVERAMIWEAYRNRT